jgi:hypothetical protein
MQHLERQEKLGPGCGLVMTKESSDDDDTYRKLK